MTFKPYQAAIEQHYNITITRSVPAPRQFVAETFFVDDDKGQRYFCKLVDKPLFIAEILRGLPLIADMHAQGMERICYPVGEAFFIGSKLAVLYNYIDAPQTHDYNYYAFGRLMAQIHSIQTRVKNPPCETFLFPYPEQYKERFDGMLTAQSFDPVTRAYQTLLREQERQIRQDMDSFMHLAELCRKDPGDLVITHGDAGGNTLVKADDDLYIIDWDEALLSVPERDMWTIDHEPGFYEGYTSVRPYKMRSKHRAYSVFRYYFRCVMHVMAEVLKEEAPDAYRLNNLRHLEEILTGGWMAQKILQARGEAKTS